MSGSCRNPASEPLAQHNRRVYDDKQLHKLVRRALIPPQALKRITDLEAENKRLTQLLEWVRDTSITLFEAKDRIRRTLKGDK